MPDTRRVAHFSQGLGLDLPDALAGDLELFAHLLEGAGVAVGQAEAQLEHFALALGERGQHVAKPIL